MSTSLALILGCVCRSLRCLGLGAGLGLSQRQADERAHLLRIRCLVPSPTDPQLSLGLR